MADFWTIEHILNALGDVEVMWCADIHSGLTINKCVFNTQHIAPRPVDVCGRHTSYTLFIPLQGNHHNGHDFIVDALKKHAISLSEHKYKASHQELFDKHCDWQKRVIYVSCTQKALEALARYAVQQHLHQRIAITGSVGKTTVRHFCGQIGARYGLTLTSDKNYNNHLGAPLTLCHLKPQHQWAFIEAGMSHEGELSALSDIIHPHIGVITAIGSAHSAMFRDQRHIAQAKAEILYHTLQTAVLPSDSAHIEFLMCEAAKRHLRIVTVGQASLTHTINIKHTSITYHLAYDQKLNIITPQGAYQTRMPDVFPPHHVYNAVVSFSTFYALGFTCQQLQDIADNLSQLTLVSNRGKAQCLSKKRNIHLIDDTYNASPESCAAAVHYVCAYGQRTNTAPIIVLGDMGEQRFSAESHKKLGELIKHYPHLTLYTYGHWSELIGQNAAPHQWRGHSDDQSILLHAIQKDTLRRTTILVKGSRSMKMEGIVEGLTMAYCTTNDSIL